MKEKLGIIIIVIILLVVFGKFIIGTLFGIVWTCVVLIGMVGAGYLLSRILK